LLLKSALLWVLSMPFLGRLAVFPNAESSLKLSS
jgi:hypothetical protein